jgi:hypothetical protein
MHFTNHRAFLAIILAIGFTLPAILTHGAEISEDRGAMGLSQALKRPDIIGRVLHSGAHPEDENGALLAWLALGQALPLGISPGDGVGHHLGQCLAHGLGGPMNFNSHLPGDIDARGDHFPTVDTAR